MMLSVDHAAEGKKCLEKGLQLIRNGDISGATEAFSYAAVEFEKAQDFRQIDFLIVYSLGGLTFISRVLWLMNWLNVRLSFLALRHV